MEQIKKKAGRIMAMLLVLAMIVTSVPQYALTASAAETAEDAAIAEEHGKAESAADAGTEAKAAEVTEQEAETTVTQTEDAEAADETETAATEAETSETAATEVDTGKDSQTEVTAETEQETERSEAEESESNDVLEVGEELNETGPSSEETEVQKATVSVRIPYILRNSERENLLEGFEYVAYPTEPEEGEITLTEKYSGSLDDLLSEEVDFKVEVPVGYVLYFKPVLKEKIAGLDWVSKGYDYSDKLTANEDGIYKISSIQDNEHIHIEAFRYYDIVFQADHAKFYASEEDISSGTELKEGRVSTKRNEALTVLVVPDEGYALKTVDSNNLAIVTSKIRNTYSISYNEFSKAEIKEPVTIFATAEISKEYDVTFDWKEADADVFVNEGEQLTQNSKTIKVSEGGNVTFYVKAKNKTKGIFVEYTEESCGETIIPDFTYDEEEDEYTYFIGEGIEIIGNISVKISVADYHTITFKQGNDEIDSVYFEYAGNVGDGEYVEFSSSDKESGADIQIPDGYELKFWFDNNTEYGSLTASTEQGELRSIWDDNNILDFYAFTPTADTTVTVDINPKEFLIDADEGIEFSICRLDESQNAYVDAALLENNRIYYYNDMGGLYLKLNKEDGKRYEVTGEYTTWGGAPIIIDLDILEEKDGYCIYGYSRYSGEDIVIGSCHGITMKSYNTVTLNFDKQGDSVSVRKFERYEDENGKEAWRSSEIREDEDTQAMTVTADKDRDCFIGVPKYDHLKYQLEYADAAGSIKGSLAFYEDCTLEDDYGREEDWAVYKFVPTTDATVTITASQLEKYTVTVVKGSNAASYSAEYYEYGYDYGVTDENKVFEEIRENSTFFIKEISPSDDSAAPVSKVEYEVGGGTRQPAVRYYDSENETYGYRIKITGNTTIYVDAVPIQEYTLKFDGMDTYEAKIWEAGNFNSFENRPLSPENGQITLKNDKEYLFDISPKDGYLVESVIAVDESGKETLVEKNKDDRRENTGYRIGTGYGNVKNFTYKVKMNPAYKLSFSGAATTFDFDIYQWGNRMQVINSYKIAVPATDSYSFYIPDNYDEARYEIFVQESESFTLTKEFRTNYDSDGFIYNHIVYTVAAKKGVAQLSKTATIVIQESKDTHTVTISEYPIQVKSANISYYSSADGESDNYKLTEGKAVVSNTVDNVVNVRTMSGYKAKVIMKGASGESELKQVRKEYNSLDYWIGELTEDKTITITVERDTMGYYGVGFSTRCAAIRDPEYKLPYRYTMSDSENNYECDEYSYQVARGSSISFIVEPEYGYKVESVSTRDGIVTPDKAGVYTVKPKRDREGIKVKTVKSDNPDNPDDPAKKSNVKFTYPSEVAITVNEYNLENNQVSVETGKQISFQAEVTDETYEIKSVTAGGVEIPVDTATGTYTITINADTEIIITAEKKQEEPQPEKKYTVRFTHPQSVYVTVDGLQTDSINDVAEGTKVYFSIICSEEDYQVKSVQATGGDVGYDTGAGSYVLTVTADTEVVIEAEQKPDVDTNAPTAVKVQGVSSKGELNLSQQNRKYTITLTPADADGSVLGVKVNPENSVIKASIVSETKGGRVTYYLSLEKPETSVGDTAEVTIYNTKTGEAISGGTIKVITRAPSTEEPDTSGLKVTFEGYDETETPSYTYTGSAVTPELEVTYNGEYLEQGTDYTVKYANNINASTDAKPAKLTITGKGSLAGKHDYTFKITPKDIGDTYDVKAGSVKVVKGAKATPILVYNGMVLGKKDFDNPKAAEKFSADSTIMLTGKGNYTGTREVKVEAVDKGQLNKISIKLDNAKNKNLAYDGTEKYPAFQVLDAKKTDITNKENEAYIVVYPENIISAGTVKFSVVGIGDYTGTVTKSYKIKPSAKSESDIVVSSPSSGGYTYVSTGVTEYDPDVQLKDGTWLEKGKDYTLAYSNNKKAGTAKCKINFIGNYKGVKAITKEFAINPFNIANFDEDNIIVTDKTSGGKPGTYKSVPYIIDNEANALIKSSEFKFTYYVDEAMKTEMKEKLTSGKIWVKIEPKNPAKGNYTGTRTVSYTIRESGTDLSKAKITFNPNKPAYTGSEVTPECSVELNKEKIDNSKNDQYSVRYLSNVYKGKATVIITGAGGSNYVGSKTATFTIAASDIK